MGFNDRDDDRSWFKKAWEYSKEHPLRVIGGGLTWFFLSGPAFALGGFYGILWTGIWAAVITKPYFAERRELRKDEHRYNSGHNRHECSHDHNQHESTAPQIVIQVAPPAPYSPSPVITEPTHDNPTLSHSAPVATPPVSHSEPVRLNEEPVRNPQPKLWVPGTMDLDL